MAYSKNADNDNYIKTMSALESKHLANMRTTKKYNPIPPIEHTPPTINMIFNPLTNQLEWTTGGSRTFVNYTLTLPTASPFTGQVVTVLATDLFYQISPLNTNTYYRFSIVGNTNFLTTEPSVVEFTTNPRHPEFSVAQDTLTFTELTVTHNVIMYDGVLSTNPYTYNIDIANLISNREYDVVVTLNYTMNDVPQTLASSNILSFRTPHYVPTLAMSIENVLWDRLDVVLTVDWKDADPSTFVFPRYIYLYKGGTVEQQIIPTIENVYTIPVLYLSAETTYTFTAKLEWYHIESIQYTNIDPQDQLTPVQPILSSPTISGVTRTKTNISFNIDWGVDIGYTVTGYSVFVGDDELSTTQVSSFDHNGLPSGTEYNFIVSKTLADSSVESSPTYPISTYTETQKAIQVGSYATFYGDIPTYPANHLIWNLNGWSDDPSDLASERWVKLYVTGVPEPLFSVNRDTQTNYYHRTLAGAAEHEYTIRKVDASGTYDSDPFTITKMTLPAPDQIATIETDFTTAYISVTALDDSSATSVSRELLYKETRDATYQTATIVAGTTTNISIGAGNSYMFKVKKISAIPDEKLPVANTINVVTFSTEEIDIVPKIESTPPTLSANSQTTASLTFNTSLGAYNDTTPPAPAEIQYRLAGLGVYTKHQDVLLTTTTVNITGLSSNTYYDIRIVKQWELGTTHSDTQEVYLYNQKTNPIVAIAVSAITITKTTTTINVSWTRNSDGDDSNAVYMVSYTTLGGSSVWQTSLSKVDIALNGLTHNTFYDIAVAKYTTINNTITHYTGGVTTDDVVADEVIVPQPPLLVIRQVRETDFDYRFTENGNGTATAVTYNIIHIDTSNTEYVSAPIYSDGSGVISGTISTNVIAGTTYRARVRKNSDMDAVYSNPSPNFTTTSTANPDVLPLMVTFGTISENPTNMVVTYTPESNGSATSATLGFFKSKQLPNGTFEPYEQYATTRDVLTDQANGSFDFNGLDADTGYFLMIKKITNLGNLPSILQVKYTAGRGGTAFPIGGLPPFSWPNQPDDDPDDGDDPEPQPYDYTIQYLFDSASGLFNTRGIEELTMTPLTDKKWYNGGLNRFVLNSTPLTGTLSVATLANLILTTDRNLTIKIVIHSESDTWRVNFGDIEVTSISNTQIKLKLGVLALEQEYIFDYDKDTLLFNEFTFAVNTDYINLYQNGNFEQEKFMSNGYLPIVSPDIQIENLSATTHSTLHDITIIYGLCHSQAQIASVFNSRFPSGQNFHRNSATVSTVLGTNNKFVSTHTLNFTQSPADYITSILLDGQTKSVSGQTSVVETLEFDADGDELSATSTADTVQVSSLVNYPFTASFLIGISTINVPDLVVAQITDATTNLYITNADVYPRVKGYFYCNADNTFSVDIEINTFKNGFYIPINSYSGYIIATDVTTNTTTNVPVEETFATTNNLPYGSVVQGSRVQVVTANDLYQSNHLKTGGMNYIKNKAQTNIINNSGGTNKALKITKGTYPSLGTSFNSITGVYTTLIYINGDLPQNSLNLNVWYDSTQITVLTATTQQSIINAGFNVNTSYTAPTSERYISPTSMISPANIRLEFADLTSVPSNIMTITYTHDQPHLTFSDDVFRAIIIEPTRHVHSYKQRHFTNTREYSIEMKNFVQITNDTTYAGMCEFDIYLNKSAQAWGGMSFQIIFTTGNDKKRRILSVTTSTALSLTKIYSLTTSTETYTITDNTPVDTGSGSGDTSVFLCKVVIITDTLNEKQVTIRDFHLAFIVDTYSDFDNNTDFNIIQVPFTFDYRPFVYFTADNTIESATAGTMLTGTTVTVSNQIETILTLWKPFTNIHTMSFNVKYDNTRITNVLIEYLLDLSDPTGVNPITKNSPSINGSLTTIQVDYADPNKQLFNNYFRWDKIKVVFTPTSDKINIDNTHIEFELLSLDFRDDATQNCTILPTPINTFDYIPAYVFDCNPAVTEDRTLAKSTVKITITARVSPIFRKVDLTFTTIDATLISIAQTSPTVLDTTHLTSISGSVDKTLTYEIDLEQVDTGLGFSDSDLTITFGSVENSNDAVGFPTAQTQTTENLDFTVLRQVSVGLAFQDQFTDATTSINRIKVTTSHDVDATQQIKLKHTSLIHGTAGYDETDKLIVKDDVFIDMDVNALNIAPYTEDSLDRYVDTEYEISFPNVQGSDPTYLIQYPVWDTVNYQIKPHLKIAVTTQLFTTLLNGDIEYSAYVFMLKGDYIDVSIADIKITFDETHLTPVSFTNLATNTAGVLTGTTTLYDDGVVGERVIRYENTSSDVLQNASGLYPYKAVGKLKMLVNNPWATASELVVGYTLLSATLPYSVNIVTASLTDAVATPYVSKAVMRLEFAVTPANLAQTNGSVDLRVYITPPILMPSSGNPDPAGLPLRHAITVAMDSEYYSPSSTFGLREYNSVANSDSDSIVLTKWRDNLLWYRGTTSITPPPEILLVYYRMDVDKLRTNSIDEIDSDQFDVELNTTNPLGYPFIVRKNAFLYNVPPPPPALRTINIRMTLRSTRNSGSTCSNIISELLFFQEDGVTLEYNLTYANQMFVRINSSLAYNNWTLADYYSRLTDWYRGNFLGGSSLEWLIPKTDTGSQPFLDEIWFTVEVPRNAFYMATKFQQENRTPNYRIEFPEDPTKNFEVIRELNGNFKYTYFTHDNTATGNFHLTP